MPTGAKRISDRGVFRLIDANLNRSREGLRVLEDTARFVWNDAKFFEGLRKERHRLDRLARRWCPELLSSRNSGNDGGRTVPEPKRSGLDGLVAANFRRCEESLRVLEEYGKLLSRQAGAGFKKARFKIYVLEKEIFKNRFPRGLNSK